MPSSAPSNVAKRRTALPPGKRKGRPGVPSTILPAHSVPPTQSPPVLPPLQTTEQHNKIIKVTPSFSGPRSVERVEFQEPRSKPGDAIEEYSPQMLVPDCDAREEAAGLSKRRRLAYDKEPPRACYDDNKDNLKEMENAGAGKFDEQSVHSFAAGSASDSSGSILLAISRAPSDVGGDSEGVVIDRDSSAASQSTTQI
ncbi:hypothetical protein PQX77_010487 [Marasmius sp. AFHP31]|nr:hypothetical protein PQX77_010487 [Marasmius sp. AFHP31]